MTVIIPCRSDLRLTNAVQSIDDAKTQPLVVLNRPSAEVRELVGKLGVDVLELDTSSLGHAREAGVRASPSSKICFLDSDCVASPGSLARIRLALNVNPVVRPLLVYRAVGPSSRIVATLRRFTTSETDLPLLPLALRKEIAGTIGGYFFQPELAWGEDLDLAQRVMAAGIPVQNLPEATIVHAALGFRADLRSAFKLGQGRWYQGRSGIARPRSLLRDVLFLGEARKAREVLRMGGLSAALYHLLGWRVAYKLGYYFSALQKKS